MILNKRMEMSSKVEHFMYGYPYAFEQIVRDLL